MNAQLMYSIISIAIFKINTCNFILYYIPLRQACDHNHSSAIHRKAHCTVLFENLLLLINSTVQLKREKMNRQISPSHVWLFSPLCNKNMQWMKHFLFHLLLLCITVTDTRLSRRQYNKQTVWRHSCEWQQHCHWVLHFRPTAEQTLTVLKWLIIFICNTFANAHQRHTKCTNDTGGC